MQQCQCVWILEACFCLPAYICTSSLLLLLLLLTHTQTHTCRTLSSVIGFILSGSFGLSSGDDKLFRAERPNSVNFVLCVFTCVFYHTHSPSVHTQTHFSGRQKERAKCWTNTVEKTLGGIPQSELRYSVRTFTHTLKYTRVHTHTHAHQCKWTVKSCRSPFSLRFTPDRNTSNQQQSIKKQK